MSEIPLKDVLHALDTNNKKFYSKLSDSQKKDFSPWLVMRYASAVSGKYDDHYHIITHEIVNKDFSSLYKHPELQWMLLSLCGVGSNQNHYFIPPGKRKSKSKIHAFVSEIYPRMKDDEINVFVATNTIDELKQLARDYGYPEKDIKEIFKR